MHNFILKPHNPQVTDFISESLAAVNLAFIIKHVYQSQQFYQVHQAFLKNSGARVKQNNLNKIRFIVCRQY